MVLEMDETHTHSSRIQTTSPMISVVIPALNEQEGIAKTISSIPLQQLANMGFDTEIIVVDNGSEDRTAELAIEAGAFVISEPRRGYGRAYKTGFSYATGDIIATADADLTYPIDEIPNMASLLNSENLDFITTDRYGHMENGAMSLQHRMGNAVLSILTRLLFRTNIRDSQSGMWVFKRYILTGMELESDGMAFSQELKIEACSFLGCRWKEIPIRYHARVGTVKLRAWRDGFGNLMHLFRKSLTRRNLPATSIKHSWVRLTNILSL